MNDVQRVQFSNPPFFKEMCENNRAELKGLKVEV